MNSEAASETQYEDSKSQLSTYRKDDKIMLKRKVLTLLLVLVLVVSMAVPAFAFYGSGTISGKPWTTETWLTSSYASAKTAYTGDYLISVNMTAYGWCNMHGSDIAIPRSNSGYKSCEVYGGNQVSIDGTSSTHACNIYYGYLTSKVGSYYVANSQYFE